MLFHALSTDELGTLLTKRFGFVIRTDLTYSLYLAMNMFHLGVDLFYTVDEESFWKTVYITMRKDAILTTLWTGKWLVCACLQGEILDTLLAVIMATRENFWFNVLVMADSTNYLFFKFLQPNWILGHHNSSAIIKLRALSLQ